jgi:hypothetical protein
MHTNTGRTVTSHDADRRAKETTTAATTNAPASSGSHE